MNSSGASERKSRPEPLSLHLRLLILAPPPGVKWALQMGKKDLVEPRSLSGSKIIFEFEIEVVVNAEPDSFRLRGPAVQGPRGGRFIYVNSGAYAGDASSQWGRRAKVPLEGITWVLIQQATTPKKRVLEAQFSGTGRDGGPACASIALSGSGWKAAT
jgi:Family of unknown function (DUF5990)